MKKYKELWEDVLLTSLDNESVQAWIDENEQLKQQLKEQPKAIVEKIIKEMSRV